MTGQARPLVTFALFAYNQEKYVRDAIEGAFSQNYTPLEIILSDDSSNDRTFEIMREMAKAYQGPHQVRARRSPQNNGTVQHVLDVLVEADGEYIVLAAGDDISHPNRARIIEMAFRKTEVDIVYSHYDLTGPEGQVISRNCFRASASELHYWFPDKKNAGAILGATSAYKCSIAKKLLPPTGKMLHEDEVFAFNALLNGGQIEVLQDSLVSYRRHDEALSNTVARKGSIADIVDFERNSASGAKADLERYAYCLHVLEAMRPSEYSVKAQILISMRQCRMRQEWISAGLWGRICLLASCRTRRELKFMFPRVFGLEVFSITRSIIHSNGTTDREA